MKEYNGNSPRNARIKINYSNSKPKVSFAYPIPKNHKPAYGNMFRPILFIWLIFAYFLLCGFYIGTDYSLEENIYGSTYLSEFSQCASIYSYQTLTNYSNVREHLCDQYIENKFYILNEIKYFLVFMVFSILPPFLIYYPFKKRWDKLYPSYSAFVSSKKITTFKKEDVKDNEEGIYVELPVFNNVVCDFKATQDFSKYLNEFEIREHRFHYTRKKTIKIGNKKRKIKKYNEFVWYARWHFTQKPIKGEIKVLYK